MDKERLRIPSDSSSGSSSHGAASPNLSSIRHTKPPYVLSSNSIGPPPNSPASFSPLLSPLPSHSLPPPPGLAHPGLLGMYQFSAGPTPGFQNVNYSLGSSVGNQAHMAGRFPSVPVPPPPVVSRQYMNGFGVQNGMMQPQPTQTSSPPPGYNYFGGHHPAQPIAQPCPIPPNINQQQTSGPFNSSQHLSYNQSGDQMDLEKRLLLLMSTSTSRGFENAAGFGREFISSHLEPVHQEECTGGLHGQMQKDDHDNSKAFNTARTDDVMNPIIENFVGSMSMCNGTYTHFGPSGTSNNKLLNGQVDTMINELNQDRQTGSTESERKSLFSKVTVTSLGKESDEAQETVFGVAPTALKQQPGYQISGGSEQKNQENYYVACENPSSPEPSGVQPRTSSPRELTETSSRPQTPGKPSYLEVLTKAGLKSQQGGHSQRKTSSTSSSPVQSAFTASTDNVPSLSHRKSMDYFIGPTSSTPSSSCPSGSSSPATKPRNLLTNVNVKGKENVSSVASNFLGKQTSAAKTSPSNSPTHASIQHQPPKAKGIQSVNGGSERTILTSQNSSTSGPKSSTKVLKNGKVSGDKAGEGGDGNEEGEWGWKTYTSRGRNNNLNSVGNKNSQKRIVNGHCSSESLISTVTSSLDDDEDDLDLRKQSSSDDTVTEKKPGSSSFASSSNSSGTVTHSRKQRDKEKPRSRKEDRNCVSRRLETLVYIWLTHMISALTWLWSLITDVASLSASLAASLIQDFFLWTKTKALPSLTDKITRVQKEICHTCCNGWYNCKLKLTTLFSRGASSTKRAEENSNKAGPRNPENILSLLGPDKNITLPANGDEALKRLLSVKGQDPYSILGVRSDCSDETVRKYYKRQAVLVHPDKNLIVGAEEAFKILARAFEMVGDPVKRAEYHQKLMEAQAKEKFCGEIGNLLEQLRKKMEAASSTIRCTKCNSRHKKNMTDRPLFAARYCSQCRIHHGAREGELWAERGGWFGIAWNYFACMDAHVWEINEWARCQKTNLKHIKADAHCVMYRLVAGGNNHQNHNNQHCHGNNASFEEGAGSEADEWDSLINNLYKSPTGSTFGKTTGAAGKTGCCSNSNVNNSSSASSNQAAGKRRKGKRNK